MYTLNPAVEKIAYSGHIKRYLVQTDQIPALPSSTYQTSQDKYQNINKKLIYTESQKQRIENNLNHYSHILSHYSSGVQPPPLLWFTRGFYGPNGCWPPPWVVSMPLRIMIKTILKFSWPPCFPIHGNHSFVKQFRELFRFWESYQKIWFVTLGIDQFLKIWKLPILFMFRETLVVHWSVIMLMDQDTWGV